jgi:proline dehydrogenase
VALAASRSKNLDITRILAEAVARADERPLPHDILAVTMRSILLWMARNPWLRERLPKLRFAKRAVRRFMPGEDVESALVAAQAFVADGIAVMFTRLGENVTRIEEADAVAEHYLGLVDTIAERGLDGEVSVKLTQLGYDIDVERSLAHCERLAERAAAGGRTFWIDMEGSDYVEGTLDLYRRLHATHPNTGVCLQAYLHRTAADIQALIPTNPAVRLVKGAYAEPPAVAYQKRADVDANYVALAVAMLEGSRAGHQVGIGLGTHDVRLIEQIAEHATALGLEKTAFEVEMLYGIRAGEQRRLAREGYRVRDLIAYGEAWYPWYMRRLAERPANVLFALRQLLP